MMLAALPLWTASAIRWDKYVPALGSPEVSPNREERAFLKHFMSADQTPKISTASAANSTMADNRVTFPENVSDADENTTTKKNSETDSSIDVEAPIEAKTAFVALNMIQTPYNCGKDQSMDANGVCREPF
ncbi:hypothetical protein MSG28_003305 [Choristoneura fumiferana]|uniref:Uncharacterized protein n=1 Tax=Choristoneura fumiferana TaxID=7141 RepID=A0ACC0KF92_CHOFU|nr:hypothetical protein MSG28_003305 [Choristoneura fumiferana]